jgi:hypothetical protein
MPEQVEQLYKRCPDFEGCKRCSLSPCPAGFGGGNLDSCYVLVPPQPAPYSPDAAREYFEQMIETAPRLKVLGLGLGVVDIASDKKTLVRFELRNMRRPHIHLRNDYIIVSRGHTIIDEHEQTVYSGTSAPDAWAAFIAEVDFPLRHRPGSPPAPAIDDISVKALTERVAKLEGNQAVTTITFGEAPGCHALDERVEKMRGELNIASEILRKHEERIEKLKKEIGNAAST